MPSTCGWTVYDRSGPVTCGHLGCGRFVLHGIFLDVVSELCARHLDLALAAGWRAELVTQEQPPCSS